jgi:hypothetical protein
MRRLLIVVLAVPVVWTAVAAGNGFAQTADRGAAEKTLIDYERKINESVAKHDKATFRSLVADDGVWARGGSFVPVALFIDALDQFEVTKWDIDTPKVLWVDASTAVLVYLWTGAGKFSDRAFAPNLLVSTVWTKRGANWVAVYHQESDALQGQ